MKSHKSEKDSAQLQSGKILQYQPYQEPRYVVHYPTTHTQKHATTHNTYQPSPVKHQKYLLTLQNHSPVDNREGSYIHDAYTRINSDDIFYNIEPQEGRIYQSVLQDPVSQI